MSQQIDTYILKVETVGGQELASLEKQATKLDSTLKKTGRSTQLGTNSYNEAAKATNGLAKQQRNMRLQVQNASYQFQDLIVQISGGTDAIRAMGQQLPQLLGGWGKWGAIIGVAAAALPLLVYNVIEYNKEAKEAAAASERFSEGITNIASGFQKINLDSLIESYNKADEAGKRVLARTLAYRLELLKLDQQATSLDFGNSLSDKLDDFFGGDVNVGQNMRKFFKDAGIEADNFNTAARDAFEGLLDGSVSAGEALQAFNKNAKDGAVAVNKETRELISLLSEQAAKEFRLAESMREIEASTVAINEAQAAGVKTLQTRAQIEAELAQIQIDADNLASEHFANEQEREKERVRLAERKKALEEAEAARAAAQARQLVESLQAQAQSLREALDPYEKYNAEVRKLQELKPYLTMDEYTAAMDRFTESYDEAVFKIADGMDEVKTKMTEAETANKNFVAGLATGLGGTLIDAIGKTKLSFSDLVSSMAKDIAKFMLNRQIMNFMNLAFPMDGGGGNSFLSGFFGSSRGNVYAGGTGLPYGVYDKPTYFGQSTGAIKPYAMGGVLGESGAEAILPLRRGEGGKLGVQSSPVNINITNNSDTDISVNETMHEDGTRQIDMLIESKMKSTFSSGGMDKIMQSTYGIRRRGA